MAKALHLNLVLIISFYIFIGVPHSASAETCTSCRTAVGNSSAFIWWPATVASIGEYIDASFITHRQWMETTWWGGQILPALKSMADELSAMTIHQTFVIGTFFDAKNMLETQQTLQQIKARAHKDYHPSTGMCQFGSVTKSLAASERKAEYNALVLSQRAQDRNLGAIGTPGADGRDKDKMSRIDQFKKTYCDPADNGNGLALMCQHGGGAQMMMMLPSTQAGAEDVNRFNKDIDYARTVDAGWTLDIDLTDAELTDDEEDIFALASNLYGHDLVRPPFGALDGESLTQKQAYYMNFRALLAKRSVAENSFNAIVSMKSNGLPGSRDYMSAVLQELGVDDTDSLKMLGDNPSYYAQMEILTKKIYQDPQFYTNLYDKPANVARKEVALQAIGLMQKFDLFKSHLRNEASLAVLLELAVKKLQDTAESEANTLTGQGRFGEN